MTKRAVVVLGASGFIGTRLVRHLVGQGDTTVRALDILPPRERLDGVDYAVVDVREPIPTQFGDDAEVIFNLAAVHRTPGHPDHEYFDTNIAGALNTVGLAEACGVKTIVFTSSISVYGPSEEMLTEASPLNAISSYGRSKRLSEQVHDAWLGRAEDRRLIVVRPGVVFGPGEAGNYTHLAKALRRGYFAYPGRRDTIKSGGYVDELVRTFDFTLARGDRKILYNFAYPTQSTIADIVNTFGEVTGRKANPATIPLAPMLFAAGLFEVSRAFGVKTAIHRERIIKLVKSTRISPAWLTSEGYHFSTDLKAALTAWRDETQGSFL